MKVEARRIVEQLAKDEPCLGAAFCTYTFDPTYFEDHVLRSVLRLGGDPDEDGARYLDEARAALCEAPVTVLADASVRQAGRRLPYDLHLIRRRTFHPKVMLVLYASEARLAVGSGNLTRQGLENNAELFFTRTLKYDDPVHAAMLRAVDDFLGECAGLATAPATQLAQLRSELATRLASTTAPGPRATIDAVFVHTFAGAGLRWFDEVLPTDAKIERVGVLAPFFERDDLEAADEEHGLRSVLGELLSMRKGSRPAVDLGVPWDEPPLVAPSGEPPSTLEAGRGLWGSRYSEETAEGQVQRIAYAIIDKLTPQRVEYRPTVGRAQRADRATVEKEVADRTRWRVPPPLVHAPANILRAIAAEHELQLWLHPAITITASGRPQSRSLHAKLVLVTARSRGALSTYALIGSANASRAALQRSVAEGGNVEAGVLVRLDGDVRLAEVLQGLVPVDLDMVRLEEREPPRKDVDLSAWIDDALHAPDARTLTITWATDATPPLGAWELRYVDRMIARGDGPAATPTTIGDFDLAATCAEVELVAGGGRWSIPIRVSDPALLPAFPGRKADLRELLAYLGQRIGAERLATIRNQRGDVGVAGVLEAIFGEGFGPTDVFKAWWGAREALTTASTLATFRNRLAGATGVRTAWTLLRDVDDEELSRDERWVYGWELCRELERVELPDGPDRAQRVELLRELMTSIRADLTPLRPPADGTPWLAAVRRFYGDAEVTA